MEVKQSWYCYMRRHGEFGWKTNLDSFKLSTLKGVIQKCLKSCLCFFHSEKMKCVFALAMVSSFILSKMYKANLKMYNVFQDSIWKNN
jgi:hypothetical protein